MPWTSDARRAPGPAAYVPGAMFVVHGADGLPVLDTAANGIARHDGVMRLDRSGTVSDPGHARVPVPGDGRLFDVGWASARDRAWEGLMATSHDMLRLPLLKRAAERWQERVARAASLAMHHADRRRNGENGIRARLRRLGRLPFHSHRRPEIARQRHIRRSAYMGTVHPGTRRFL